jgi:hypothetical protein
MVRLAQVVEYRAGTPKVQGSLPPSTFWSCGFLYLIGLSVTSKPFQTRNSIDGGFNINVFLLVSYEHFFNICNKKPAKKLNWAWFSFIKKNLICITESDGEDGRAVNSETQGCGFYPHMGQILVALF